MMRLASRILVAFACAVAFVVAACADDGASIVETTSAPMLPTPTNATGQPICTSLKTIHRELVADDTFVAEERAALVNAAEDLHAMSAGHIDFSVIFAPPSAANDLRRIVSTDPAFASISEWYAGAWWGWTGNNQVLFAADRIPATTSTDPLAWRATATHEMGHLANFYHSTDPQALMCGWPEAPRPCVGQRTLTEIDRRICESLCECE